MPDDFQNEQDRLLALSSYAVLDSPSDETFEGLARMTAMLTRAPISLISLVDSERVWFKARHGFDVDQVDRRLSFCAHAIETPEQILVIEDTHADPRYADNPVVVGDPYIRFYAGHTGPCMRSACIPGVEVQPLVSPQGHALGSLCILDREPRLLTEADRDVLQCVGRAVTDTLELRRAALTDLLTGLSNRRHFMFVLEGAIERCRRDGVAFGLLAIDTDGFKQVNDRHGHDAGDRVLQQVARLMVSNVRRSDTVARLGGDEFAVLLTGSATEVALVGERLRVTAATRAHGGGVTLSIGAVTFTEPPNSIAAALKLADRLVYAAKLEGKNRVRSAAWGGTASGAALAVEADRKGQGAVLGPTTGPALLLIGAPEARAEAAVACATASGPDDQNGESAK